MEETLRAIEATAGQWDTDLDQVRVEGNLVRLSLIHI